MEEAEAHAKISKRENRLYIGNLAYDVTYRDLKKFMEQGGSGLDAWMWKLPGLDVEVAWLGCGVIGIWLGRGASIGEISLHSIFEGRGRKTVGACSGALRHGWAVGESESFLHHCKILRSFTHLDGVERRMVEEQC